MNPWDVLTWISSLALGASALLIFGFFLRDARSIFDREMHDEGGAPKGLPESGSAADAEGHDDPNL